MAIATASRDPPRDVSDAPPAPAGWALFDRRVALGDPAPATTAAAAVSKTSNGRDVRVTLGDLATPPSSSCVHLHTDDNLFRKPSIVSADGDLLLIHMVVAVKGRPTIKFPHNFFVYHADPELPWIQPLPPPSNWITQAEDTGIAAGIGNAFAVANLRTYSVVVDHTTMRHAEVAVVRIYRSAGAEQWETKRLAMPTEKGFVEFDWFTDAVFTFRGLVCWVDYHRGILYCDVFSDDTELGFLRFPGIVMWRGDRGLPAMYRTVSIFRGQLKFVDVDNGQFRCVEGDENGSIGSDDNGYSIRTWSLKMPELEWEEDAGLHLEEYWSLPSYRDSRLPPVAPTFPIVSLQEANVLHFVVEGPGFSYTTWMVTVDVKKKTLTQYALYQNPIEEAEDCRVDVSNMFFHYPMVSIQLFK